MTNQPTLSSCRIKEYELHIPSMAAVNPSNPNNLSKEGVLNTHSELNVIKQNVMKRFGGCWINTLVTPSFGFLNILSIFTLCEVQIPSKLDELSQLTS